jgi:hypothetical protein
MTWSLLSSHAVLMVVLAVGVLGVHHHGAVTGPLAPDLPCEQGLTVVRGGCWHLCTPGVLAELHPQSTLQVLLVGMG